MGAPTVKIVLGLRLAAFRGRGLSFIPDPAKTNNISVYSFNAGSGALSKVQDVNISGGAHFLAVDPSGKFLLAETFTTNSSRGRFLHHQCRHGGSNSLERPVHGGR